MNTLERVGGVRVYGKDEDAWSYSKGRVICQFPAEFNSDAFFPDTNFSDNRFELPCHRGKNDYEIHLLESGEAIVFKEGRVYLCTRNTDGKPRVLTFVPVPADKEAASSR